MRELLHTFLKWLPAAVGAGLIGVATAWSEARDWIGFEAGILWEAMRNPLVTLLVLSVVAAYFAAIVWTSKPRNPAASMPPSALSPEAYEAQYRHRQMLLARGRDLAHRFSTDIGQRNFRRFLEADRVFPEIRPHLSRAFFKILNFWPEDRPSRWAAVSAAQAQSFLDEIDRIEREWGLS
jgi:hypothetical protein